VDEDAGGGAAVLDLAEEFEAVAAGEGEIEDDDGEGLGFDGGECFGNCGDGDARAAGELGSEGSGEALADEGVVINEE
jgi:hypothetical protein